ncbi:haloacid dehalogenase [Desulfococcaceae bacterium HSG9]|nr:haloacid dehalogenase [Desulfococcaceae bacterium HSG9]
MMINPASLAFDIDGVVADTMGLFLRIARDDYNIMNVDYENITSYLLEDCLGSKIDKKIIDIIITQLIDGNYVQSLQAIDGAPEALNKIADAHTPLLFVTARPYPGPIRDWLTETVGLSHSGIHIISTGSFDKKTDVLLKHNVTHFVEDRLETCFDISKAGLHPILFKQPWNRERHPFKEVESWNELTALINF